MNQLPSIQSLGRPPELHADRVVAQMLQIITRDRARCWPKIHEVLGERRRHDGNPKAQQKLFERMKEAVNGFLLWGTIETGKRGKYCMYLVVLDGWDAERKQVVFGNDRIPDKPWITVSTIKIEGKGHGRYHEEGANSLFITHHALSRLTQRCGARSLKDVYGCVKMICRTFIISRAKADPPPLRPGHQFRAELPYDLGTATCALEPYADGKGGFVVATLWKDANPAATA
jgi:hypothetical protein